ncbi:MAG: zinc metallopeptidase [Exiguobacterium sp.]|uniref:Zinc metallopeptidase n=1 Tax=Exiguobacterium alkaliphilum TaxID=1428684 RepID=A0ABT2KWG9_9BACL|nr:MULTISPECIES: neutral zinc metallopeptidase [Exiguobacterium]MDX5323178.1 zinc metallopeptidase [Exiguobacterium sp.]KDN59477.1 metalloprotease [Exiguobacterium sp. AB2]MCT4795262.1 zinc metallopeptidase [Exiguobacterium alkaliphilum]MDX5424963.1 zinc metallopeptidase [Exiguobacterium sp.]MDX6772408.1 zinc metallopeptidase [Exiguobacterium sp.]
MKWKGRQASRNVEDRRGQRVGGKGIAGIGGGFGLILVIVFTLLNGGNPADIVNNIGLNEPQSAETYQGSAREEEMADFVSVVLRDTEEVWTDIFAENGLTYREPTLVLFTGQVESACGIAGSAVGPFYCPGDQKLYIDLSFYDELSQRFNAPGDFAMAYVVAHEVGHHVQTLLGTTNEIMPLRNEMSEAEFNKYLVRFELQADYYAGVWAHHAQGMGYLEAGDFEEAMNAAHQIGDDTLQKQAQGYVTPDSFTHGTSEQRKRWFEKGFQNGTIQGGDTFNTNNL